MRISLAPLHGVTTRVFREALYKRFGGIDYAVAPFVPTVAGDDVPLRIIKDIVPTNESLQLIPQVIGKDPAQLRVMARALRNHGYTRMNLNCGCPWNMVAKKGRGCGLPENETVFAQMLEAGCESMPGGFSIKIRLGLKDNKTLAKRAALIASFPLDEIIIHPRTGVQMYEGEADADAFAEVLPMMRCPVVYNGDIRTADDFRRIAARFPTLSGVMIGRGLIADPFLAADIKSGVKTPYNPAAVLDFLAELHNSFQHLGRMKELWSFAHAYFRDDGELLRAVQRSQTMEEYGQITGGIACAT